MSRKVVIIFGSKADVDFAEPLKRTLKEFGIDFDQRIASAHKTPEKVLKILEEYEKSGAELVYITIAGRSNALSGLVDANTKYPVIACPPYSEKFAGVDIYSSLRMPSGVAPLVVIEPEAAALAAAKIFALKDEEISKKIAAYRRRIKEKLEADDQALRRQKQ
jgi:5-(carboxyamino)imidazole ribonucleotide mutase